MKTFMRSILGLLVACALVSCGKPEPQTMVTFSYDGTQLSRAFKMSGEVVSLPLDAGEAGLQKFRFVVEEDEWVEFAIDEGDQSLSYQANFSSTPHYKFDFVAAAGHGFYMQGDPETHYISKHLNVPQQGGTVHWR